MGAHVENMLRTTVRDFSLDQARSLEQLETLAQHGKMDEALVPAAELLPEAPPECVDSITAAQILHGRDFRVSPFRVRQGARLVKALDNDGRLLAIGEIRLPNLYHPIVVL